MTQTNIEGESRSYAFIVIIRREEIRVSRESTWCNKEFARDMDHFEVKVSKVQEPVSLSLI